MEKIKNQFSGKFRGFMSEFWESRFISKKLSSLKVFLYDENWYFSLLGICFFSIISGIILKTEQIKIVYPDLIQYYPYSYYLDFIFIQLLSVTVFVIINSYVLSFFYGFNTLSIFKELSKYYIFLSFAYINGYQSSFYYLPILLVLINLFILRNRLENIKNIFTKINENLKVDMTCIMFIVFIHALFFLPLIDPLSPHYKFFSNSGEDVFINVMINTLIKSTTVLQEPAWMPNIVLGSTPFYYGLFPAYIYNFLYSIFPISSIDFDSIAYLHKLVIFFIYILGAIGYYIVIRRIFNLHYFIAISVSLISILNIGVMDRNQEICWGYSVYIFPYIFLLLNKSINSRKYWMFGLSGIIISILSNLLFLQGEILIHSLLFSVLFILWSFLFEKKFDKENFKFYFSVIVIFLISYLLINYRLMTFLSDDYSLGTRVHHNKHGLIDYKSFFDEYSSLFGLYVKPDFQTFSSGLLGSFFFSFGIFSFFQNPNPIENQNLKRSYTFGLLILLVSPLLNASSVAEILALLNVPGFPGHVNARVITYIHSIYLVGIAFGINEFYNLAHKRSLKISHYLFILIYFLIIKISYFVNKEDIPLKAGVPNDINFQIIIAILGLILYYKFLKQEIISKIILTMSIFYLSIFPLSIFALISPATKNPTIISHRDYNIFDYYNVNMNYKNTRNNLLNRIKYRYYLNQPLNYPIDLEILLNASKRNSNDFRTKKYVFNLLKRYKDFLAANLEIEKDQYKDDSSTEKQLTLAKIKFLLSMIKEDYNLITKEFLDLVLKEISKDFNRDISTYEKKHIEWDLYNNNDVHLIYSLVEIPIDLYLRINGNPDRLAQYYDSNAFIHGYVSAYRWNSTLDYFSNEKDLKLAFQYIPGVQGSLISDDQKFINLLNFKYHQVSNQDFSNKTFNPNYIFKYRYPLSSYYIFENPDALPRVTIFYNYKNIEPIKYSMINKDDFGRIRYGIKQLNSVDIYNSLIIEDIETNSELKDISSLNANIPRNDQVEILNIIGNFAVFKVKNLKEKGLLFYSDMFHPSWKAFINDTQTKIYRSDLAFKSILVPEGDSFIWFEFRSLKLFLLKTLSFFLFISLSFFGMNSFKRDHK